MKYGSPTRVYAQVIADSISPAGDRLTTMEVQCHRFVLAEFNTHRVFSRNSASSRAIPVAKQLARVSANPAMPLQWPTEKPGMQGGHDLPSSAEEAARHAWLEARDSAITAVNELQALGVHKSVTNRLLEPFMWHRIIVSSTEWQNFFAQRVSPLAQPEIRAVATCMRDALSGSTPFGPRPYTDVQWHLPYVDDAVYDALAGRDGVAFEDVLKVSAARCARVSYLTHDGKRDVAADIELYDRLIAADPPHWSPLEHVARPLRASEPQVGNFNGWRQLRHEAVRGS